MGQHVRGVSEGIVLQPEQCPKEEGPGEANRASRPRPSRAAAPVGLDCSSSV